MSAVRLLEIIQAQVPHENYNRSLHIAHQAKLVMAETSIDQKELVEHIRKSENHIELQQRLRLSTPITGAALIGPLSYQNRIYRAPDRLEMFSAPDNMVQQQVNANFERFFAGKTLYEFVFEQSCYANNYDPGTILLFEQTQNENGYSRVYPVPISSAEAFHIKYDDYGELKELAFFRVMQGVSPTNHAGYYKQWYFYGTQTSAEAIEVNEFTPVSEFQEYKSQTIAVNNNTVDFYYREYEMPLGFVPAIPLGAYRDYQSPTFHGKALFYQGALPILHKFANLGTMMDIMDTTSAFPEKYRYVPDCDYQNEQGEICEGGVFASGGTCPACKGTGKKYAITEQKIIEFAFEAGMAEDDVIELSKLAYDHRPPVESLEYLNTKIQGFFRMIQALVFNQDLTEAISMKTATEVRAAVDAITNHLMPMAERIEAAWEMAHKCALAYNAPDAIDESEYSCKHPDDFQVNSMEDVIKNLNETIKAGGTPEAVAGMQRRLLFRIYPNDSNYVGSAMAFNSFLPFASMPKDQQYARITELPDDHPDRVLTERAGYIQANVFSALEQQGVYFSELTRPMQRSMIEAEVKRVIDEEIKPNMPLSAPDAPVIG